MNNCEAFCRLCAKSKHTSKLADLQINVEKCSEVNHKLTRINAVMDFDDTILPKTVCFVCLQQLDSAYDFVTNVEQAQTTLNDFMLIDVKTETNSIDDGTITYEGPELKNEEDNRIKIEIDSDKNNKKIEKIFENNRNFEDVSACESTDEDTPLIKMKKEKKPKTETKKKKTKNVIKPISNSINKSNSEVESTWKEFNWKCGFCKTEFPTPEELTTHSIEIHNRCNPFRCTMCTSRKYTLNLLVKHIHRLHRKDLKLSCFKCYETFPNISSTLSHIASHKTSKHICPGCNTGFPDEIKLKNHCDTYYETKRDLNALLSEKADGLTCLTCKKTFKGKYSLANHFIRSHLEFQKNYVCEICGYKFRTQGCLNDHMLTHTEVRPFKCKLCALSFKSEPILRRHVTLHDGKEFPCEKCGKVFKRQFYLKKHSFVHTDVMPWKCDVCEKLFKRKEFLTRHMQLHSGVKPYSCDICNKSYVDWPNYNKHMRTLHGKDMSKTKRTPQGVFRVDTSSGELIKPEVDKEVQDWREKLKLEKGKRRRRLS